MLKLNSSFDIFLNELYCSCDETSFFFFAIKMTTTLLVSWVESLEETPIALDTIYYRPRVTVWDLLRVVDVDRVDSIVVERETTKLDEVIV